MNTLTLITKYFYPRTILDIGAHTGEFHVYTQHLFEITGVEIHPTTGEIIQENILFINNG
jgi:tRNA1(Val) A37 N6-methylase TrmN6